LLFVFFFNQINAALVSLRDISRRLQTFELFCFVYCFFAVCFGL